MPAVVLAVDDLPRTRSGKLVELAVADAVNGRPVRNREAIANPEAIDAIAARARAAAVTAQPRPRLRSRPGQARGDRRSPATHACR